MISTTTAQNDLSWLHVIHSCTDLFLVLCWFVDTVAYLSTHSSGIYLGKQMITNNKNDKEFYLFKVSHDMSLFFHFSFFLLFLSLVVSYLLS